MFDAFLVVNWKHELLVQHEAKKSWTAIHASVFPCGGTLNCFIRREDPERQQFSSSTSSFHFASHLFILYSGI
jgi:hypothetical protein